jgi:DNA-binding transcriptional LysR family regulator
MAEITLAGLRVLREVADRGSFTAAAAPLGYTQSAISRQVAALEGAAGAPLFARVARGVTLTPAGEALLRHANAVLDRLEEARRELAGVPAAPLGRLRVGAFPIALAALVPRALAALRAEHPALQLTLREGTTPTQLRRLRDGALDVAVVAALPGDPLDAPGLRLEPVVDDALLVAVASGHRLAGREAVGLDELAGEPWIEAGEPLLGVWPALRGRSPTIALTARSWTAKLGLVAAGLGITVVPWLAAPALPAGVTLVRVRGEPATVRTVLIATPAEPAPYADAFAAALRDAAAA